MENLHGYGLQELGIEAQYVLEYSRGAKVPKKHWKNVKGIIVSDLMEIICLTVFDKNPRQRCTAHLQRESKDVANKSISSHFV